MSLIASASVWTNDDSTQATSNNKKRIPTMRKPSRKPTTISEDPGSGWKSNSKIGSEDLFISDDSIYQDDSEITKSQDAQAERNARVNQLLNQLTDTNDGNKLADFQPLTHPAIQPNRVDSNPLQIPPPPVIQRSSPFIPISPDLGNTTNTNPYGNYKNMYDPEAIAYMQKNQPGLGKGSSSGQMIDSKLMDKINYMIHMLEQQQNEKTSNITEEFILYTFLGVFMIFIVDSFARSGRYTR